MNNKKEEIEIGKPILFNNKVVSLHVNKDKSISFTDEQDLSLDKKEIYVLMNRLSALNNNTVQIPLNWEESWVRLLLNIFAALSTFTILNYLFYKIEGVKLNYMNFVYDLTWIIIVLIPIAIVVGHIFSSKSLKKAKFNFLKASLPKVDLVYFITAFYNNLNNTKHFSKSDQAIRNANVITKDIFDVDGLKMLEEDLRKWLKSIGLGIK